MNLCLGIVKANYDADHPGMVQVTIPDLEEDGSEAAWLPVAAPYAGKDYGVYFLPEKGEQVIVGFLGGDSGVVLGSLWNQRNKIPDGTVTEENKVRSVVTKGGHKVIMTDGDDASVKVKTKAGHMVIISDKEQKITLVSSNGQEKIVLDEGCGAITIDADKSVSIKAQDIKLTGKITVKGQTVSIESDNSLKIKSNQTNLESNALAINGGSTEIKGSGVKVSSSAFLYLQGSLIKIN